MIRIVLRGLPRGKQAIATDHRDGHAYTPGKTRDEMAALRYAATQVMGDRPPLAGDLVLDLVILLPIPQSWSKRKQADARAGAIRPRKPDYDNCGKMLDALSFVVWQDDAQIADARVRKWYSDVPAWIVTVRQAEPEPPPSMELTR